MIGRSYGADVAIELALRDPGGVRALALLEGGESLSEGGRRWLAELEEMFTANGPAIVAEFRGGFLDAGPEELAAIAQPTLLVAADDSPPAFAEATAALASAIPSARVARVPGGHLIDPAGPDILAFIDEVLAPG